MKKVKKHYRIRKYSPIWWIRSLAEVGMFAAIVSGVTLMYIMRL